MKDPVAFWLKVTIIVCVISFAGAVLSFIDKMQLRRDLAAAQARASIGTTVCTMVKHRLAADARELLVASPTRELAASAIAGDRLGDGADAIGLCAPGFDFSRFVECRGRADYQCMAAMLEHASTVIAP